ncbi:MAG: restriction endonuclease subunit R, partial [Paracoccaceae bacterium]
FNQNPDLSEGSSGASLSERLFAARVELVGELDRHGHPDVDDPAAVLRRDVVALLRAEVDGMNVENFIVRPKRRVVEKYRADDVWSKLGLDERTELIDHIAGLPSAVVDDDISAKQFDYLMLQTQLAVLRAERAFAGYKKRIVDLASALEELGNVPMVAAEMAFILEIQTDEF